MSWNKCNGIKKTSWNREIQNKAKVNWNLPCTSSIIWCRSLGKNIKKRIRWDQKSIKKGIKQVLQLPISKSSCSRMSGASSFIKKKLQYMWLSVKFAKFLRKTFLQNSSCFCFRISGITLETGLWPAKENRVLNNDALS